MARLVGFLVGMAIIGGDPAAARALPELRVTALSARPGQAAVRVTVTVKNRGDAMAGRSRTAIFASADGRRDAGDRRLGALPTSRLAPGRADRSTARLRVPRALRSGSFWLFACADRCRRTRRAAALTVPAGGDVAPPAFAGIKRATTCIAGPLEPGKKSAHTLRWDAASDDVDPVDALVYDVYIAATADGHDFSRADHTTSAGATSFTTPPLAVERSWYFVVRARDTAGNRDANRTSVAGRNICR